MPWRNQEPNDSSALYPNGGRTNLQSDQKLGICPLSSAADQQDPREASSVISLSASFVKANLSLPQRERFFTELEAAGLAGAPSGLVPRFGEENHRPHFFRSPERLEKRALKSTNFLK